MSKYQIQPSQVLIIPGYNNQEILDLAAQSGDKTASAIKNGTSSKDKTKSSSKKTGSPSKTDKKTDKTSSGKSSSSDKTSSSGKSSSSGKTSSSKKTSVTSKKNKKSKTTKKTSKTSTTKKTDKASSKTKKTSKVNESSAATSSASKKKVSKPKALLFSPESVEYTPHRTDYEEFNSAEGLILIEKACDQFAELQLSLSVHQAMRIQENGTLELSKDDKRPIDIISEGAPTALDSETKLGHFLDPADFTDSYIRIREGFFDNYIGRPLTLISDLFPTIPVCYISDLNYNINEGEESAEYSITFREVDNTWN